MATSDGESTTLMFFVADTLSDDIERLEQILTDLNDTEHSQYRDFWPREFSRTEVIGALAALVELGHARVVDDHRVERTGADVQPENPRVGDLWFELTDAGRQALERWSFPQSL
jgi:hypothetical protein